MADMPVVGSPEWWLERLEKQLADQRKRIDTPERYYDGKHPMKFASKKFERAFGSMFLDACDNWMPLVVDSVQERLRIEGFRVGSKTAADKRVWRIFQANNLDADSDILFKEALIDSIAFTQVWPNAADPKTPHIYIEHASQVTVAIDPADRRTRLAALKVWQDDDGTEFATLYLPDFVYKFKSKANKATGVVWGSASNRWERREVANEAWPLRNSFGVVPIVPIANKQRMLGHPESELGNHYGTQDTINKLTLDMMVAAEFAAFRQRWATGLEVPIDPKTKKPVEPFDAAVDRVWASKSKDVTFGEFGTTDLANYTGAIEMQVQHLASQSRTPPHYIFVRGNMPSGESLRSAETGLVKKVVARQRSFGEGIEETMRLALNAAGVQVRGAESMSTLWADAESRTEAEHTDSVLKRLSMGVPLRQIWRDAEYSDEQIDGFADMLKEEALYRRELEKARPLAVSKAPVVTESQEASGISANDSAQ